MSDQALYLAPEPSGSMAQAGDRALEFDLFFEAERAKLFRALCLVTPNRFEAEELAQDAFLALYERRDRFRSVRGSSGSIAERSKVAVGSRRWDSLGRVPPSARGAGSLLEVAEAAEMLLHLVGLGVADVRADGGGIGRVIPRTHR